MKKGLLSERADQLVLEFSSISDWESRYKRVIDFGKNLSPLPAESKSNRFLIEGCVSQAWLVPSRIEKSVVFQADSEASIVKGILALLCSVYSHASPQEILDFEPSFLETIGLSEHLSMNRRNGMSQVIKQIRLYAKVFQAQDLLR